MDINKLKGVIPDAVFNELPSVMEKFHMNTALRLSHFLAQASHESGGFKLTEENLNYSVDGLKKIFPKYFPNNLAESYARKPEKIGSRVYASRMGNGDEASGEGYKRRGFGYLQCTGKNNQTAFFKSIGLDENSDPKLIATKYPLLSAGWFFDKNALNAISDLGSTDEVVKKVTLKVNGGVNGLEDRIKYFNKFYNLLK